MKTVSLLSTAAFALLLATSCSDADDTVVVNDEETVTLTTVEEPAADVLDESVYEDEVTEAPDRAVEPTPAINPEYVGLMEDEIRYRQLNGDVDWNSVPRSEWDGAEDL